MALHTRILKDHRIDLNKDFELFLRAFKLERELEVWVKPKKSKIYQKIITYDFCKFSGELGPKRMEGDLQIPEGLYHIDRFNPQSSFHLSLGINYPNSSDKTLGDKEYPGSDIFIHGGCATIGCIPITNPLIEELYTLASVAKEIEQAKISVHIFPTRMTANKVKAISSKHPQHQSFWANLQAFYDFFETKKQLPPFSIDDAGRYVLSNE